MATRHYRAQVTIPMDSGLPKDAVVNTWHFWGDDSSTDEVNAVDFLAQLDTFYSGFIAQSGSTQANWNANVVKFYCFEESPPRIPFYESAFTPGAPPAAQYDLTPDVAVVLSLQAQRQSGVNMRRRRGRIYLGPLSIGASDQPLMPNGPADAIAAAADSAFFGAGQTTLCVYSPYTHHGVPVGENIKDYPDEVPSQLLLSFHEVETMWVDNEFDTQRRRGLSATYRKTYTK